MCAKTKPTFTIDVQHYQKYLDDSNISDEDKTELLEVLWEIICEIVSLGFGVHPVQQAQGACGQRKETPPQIMQDDSDKLVSDYNSALVEAFTKASIDKKK